MLSPTIMCFLLFNACVRTVLKQSHLLFQCNVNGTCQDVCDDNPELVRLKKAALDHPGEVLQMGLLPPPTV